MCTPFVMQEIRAVSVSEIENRHCVKNAIKRVFYGLAGEQSRLMNWPDPSPARSLSLVVG